MGERQQLEDIDCISEESFSNYCMPAFANGSLSNSFYKGDDEMTQNIPGMSEEEMMQGTSLEASHACQLLQMLRHFIIDMLNHIYLVDLRGSSGSDGECPSMQYFVAESGTENLNSMYEYHKLKIMSSFNLMDFRDYLLVLMPLFSQRNIWQNSMQTTSIKGFVRAQLELIKNRHHLAERSPSESPSSTAARSPTLSHVTQHNRNLSPTERDNIAAMRDFSPPFSSDDEPGNYGRARYRGFEIFKAVNRSDELARVKAYFAKKAHETNNNRANLSKREEEEIYLSDCESSDFKHNNNSPSRNNGSAAAAEITTSGGIAENKEINTRNVFSSSMKNVKDEDPGRRVVDYRSPMIQGTRMHFDVNKASWVVLWSKDGHELRQDFFIDELGYNEAKIRAEIFLEKLSGPIKHQSAARCVVKNAAYNQQMPDGHVRRSSSYKPLGRTKFPGKMLLNGLVDVSAPDHHNSMGIGATKKLKTYWEGGQQRGNFRQEQLPDVSSYFYDTLDANRLKGICRESLNVLSWEIPSQCTYAADTEQRLSPGMLSVPYLSSADVHKSMLIPQNMKSCAYTRRALGRPPGTCSNKKAAKLKGDKPKINTALSPPNVTLGLTGASGGFANLACYPQAMTYHPDSSNSRAVRLTRRAMEFPYVHGVAFETSSFAWIARTGNDVRRYLVKKYGWDKSRLYAVERIEVWRKCLTPERLAKEIEQEKAVLSQIAANPVDYSTFTKEKLFDHNPIPPITSLVNSPTNLTDHISTKNTDATTSVDSLSTSALHELSLQDSSDPFASSAYLPEAHILAQNRSSDSLHHDIIESENYSENAGSISDRMESAVTDVNPETNDRILSSMSD